METYIKGTYKRCIFSSNDGYTIGLIKIKETDDQDLLDYVGKQFYWFICEFKRGRKLYVLW